MYGLILTWNASDVGKWLRRCQVALGKNSFLKKKQEFLFVFPPLLAVVYCTCEQYCVMQRWQKVRCRIKWCWGLNKAGLQIAYRCFESLCIKIHLTQLSSCKRFDSSNWCCMWVQRQKASCWKRLNSYPCLRKHRFFAAQYSMKKKIVDRRQKFLYERCCSSKMPGALCCGPTGTPSQVQTCERKLDHLFNSLCGHKRKAPDGHWLYSTSIAESLIFWKKVGNGQRSWALDKGPKSANFVRCRVTLSHFWWSLWRKGMRFVWVRRAPWYQSEFFQLMLRKNFSRNGKIGVVGFMQQGIDHVRTSPQSEGGNFSGAL